MNYRYPIISYMIFCTLTACEVGAPKDVLFIGNSLTYYHEMPNMLQSMLSERYTTINVDHSTYPGYSVSDHLNQRATIQKINSQKWDIVILQEGTVGILIPEVREYSYEAAVLKFDSIIKENGGQTMLYQSFAMSKYPKKYCYPSDLINESLENDEYCSDLLLNSKQEFRIIEEAYNALSNKLNCEIAPIGQAFELSKKKYPELVLFESATDTHPSVLGSYLIAVVFYKKITGEMASTIKFNGGLNQNDAHKIKIIADSTESYIPE